MVDKIVYQKYNKRYVIRIKGNHWFPEDLDIVTEADYILSQELHTKPQIFDSNQLVI